MPSAAAATLLVLVEVFMLSPAKLVSKAAGLVDAGRAGGNMTGEGEGSRSCGGGSCGGGG